MLAARKEYKWRIVGIAKNGNVQFEVRNANFDTGRPSRYGEYVLADETYAELLDELSDRRFESTPVALSRNIVAFYGENPRPALNSRKARKQWTRVERALKALKQTSDRRAGSSVE